MINFPTHPAAEAFPLIEGKEFDEFCKDIKRHGLREPIWRDRDGRILDGRNRLRACLATHTDPHFRTYDGDDLIEFIISMNIKRRHLNDAQRAMIASKLATMKQGARTDLSPIGEKSQAQAARMLNVSKRSVERAAAIGKEAPDLAEKIEAGELTINAATQEIAARKIVTGPEGQVERLPTPSEAKRIARETHRPVAASDNRIYFGATDEEAEESLRVQEQTYGGVDAIKFLADMHGKTDPPHWLSEAYSHMLIELESEHIDHAIEWLQGLRKCWNDEAAGDAS